MQFCFLVFLLPFLTGIIYSLRSLKTEPENTKNMSTTETDLRYNLYEIKYFKTLQIISVLRTEIVSGMTFNLVGRKASKMSDTDRGNHKMLVHLTSTRLPKNERSAELQTKYLKIRRPV